MVTTISPPEARWRPRRSPASSPCCWRAIRSSASTSCAPCSTQSTRETRHHARALSLGQRLHGGRAGGARRGLRRPLITLAPRDPALFLVDRTSISQPVGTRNDDWTTPGVESRWATATRDISSWYHFSARRPGAVAVRRAGDLAHGGAAFDVRPYESSQADLGFQRVLISLRRRRPSSSRVSLLEFVLRNRQGSTARYDIGSGAARSS